MEGIIASENVKLEETDEGYLISVAENSKENIKINFEEEKDIKLIVGMNSEVNVLGMSKGIVDVFVGENSKIDYISVVNPGSEVVKNAEVEKDGMIKWVECCLHDSKSFIKTKLVGDGSESESLSIIFGNNKEIFDAGNEVIHLGNGSKSNMLTRVVLDKEAKADFKGLVRVSKNAKGCEGYQKKETILLSEDAKMDAVPNLEIENNDVRCSHGATISQIDDEKLFYLMSRGLDDKEARRSIVEGFFDPILAHIEDDKVRDNIKNDISTRLEGLS
jgi:Fe-S cluster assembly protein SufD